LFCKHCGMQNIDGALYCSQDGLPLVGLSETVYVIKDNIRFCKSCSYENGVESQYCTNCGISLEKINERKSSPINITVPQISKLKNVIPSRGTTRNSLGTFSGDEFIGNVKYAGIAFVVVLIVSMTLAFITDRALKEPVAWQIGIPYGVVDKFKLATTTDFIMLSNFSSLRYSLEMAFMKGSLVTKGGLLVFVIIPAIALIVAGYSANRRFPDRTAIERFYASLSIAAIYAILTGVVSLFAGVSVKIGDPSGFLTDGLLIKASYSFMTALINSFILGIIFATLGAMIGMPKKNKGLGGNAKYGISIHRAILHSVLGIVLCAGLMFGVLVANGVEPVGGVIVAPQFGGYFWSLAHFGKVSFSGNFYGDQIKASYSILGGWKVSENEGSFTEIVYEVSKHTWLCFLAPLLVHFWAGNILRKSTAGNIIFELGAYAIAFGLANAAIFSLINFSMFTNIVSTSSLKLGVPILASFFFSAIVAFVISYIWVMATNRGSTKTTTPGS